MEYNMKKTLILLLLALSLNAQEFSWMNLEQARKLSKNNQKVIMVFVSKSDCSACLDIRQRINTNLLIQSTLEQVLPVKLSYKKAQKLFPSTMVTPTFYFINAQGTELIPAVKGSPADDYEFIDYISSAAAVAEIMAEAKNSKK